MLRPDGLAALLCTHGWDCSNIDIVNVNVPGEDAASHDLRRASVRDQIQADTRQGQYQAIVKGTPCETASKTKTGPPGPRPLRSAEHTYGLPKARPSAAEHTQVRNGTHLALQSAGMADELGIPWLIENPHPAGNPVSLFNLPECSNSPRHRVSLPQTSTSAPWLAAAIASTTSQLRQMGIHDPWGVSMTPPSEGNPPPTRGSQGTRGRQSPGRHEEPIPDRGPRPMCRRHREQILPSPPGGNQSSSQSVGTVHSTVPGRAHNRVRTRRFGTRQSPRVRRPGSPGATRCIRPPQAPCQSISEAVQDPRYRPGTQIQEGAPLGIIHLVHPVEYSQHPQRTKGHGLRETTPQSSTGWENHRLADSDPEVCKALLQGLEGLGHGRKHMAGPTGSDRQ